MSSKLFSFSRPLPEPFDKVKRKVKVSSSMEMGRSPRSAAPWLRRSWPISSVSMA